jgi:two-component system, NarL family, sensor kinase
VQNCSQAIAFTGAIVLGTRRVCNSDQTPDFRSGTIHTLELDPVLSPLTAPVEDYMWTLSKHLKLSHAHSELETLILERTEELQRLSQRLLMVQDEERRKVARDLHDSTGQTLAALKIAVSFLAENCKEDSATRALISDVVRLADQAIGEIRTTSYLLHPPLLDEVGLACAAEWYIDGFAKRSGINVKADIANSHGRLPRKMEIALFRVLQESLTNVHRHSGASDASIRLQYEAEAVVLEIRDFGRGISEERLRLLVGPSAETGIGLAGMRERLREMNGKLEIESDSHGTSMRATVPLYAGSLPIQFGNRGEAGVSAQA